MFSYIWPIKDRLMLCKTDAGLNNTSEKNVRTDWFLRNCQKTVESVKMTVLKGIITLIYIRNSETFEPLILNHMATYGNTI